MCEKKHIDIIQTLIKTGHITFWSNSHFGGIVQVEVTSDIFTDAAFGLDIDENLWDDGPNHAVASIIADLLEEGKLQVKPELLEEEY